MQPDHSLIHNYPMIYAERSRYKRKLPRDPGHSASKTQQVAEASNLMIIITCNAHKAETEKQCNDKELRHCPLKDMPPIHILLVVRN